MSDSPVLRPFDFQTKDYSHLDPAEAARQYSEDYARVMGRRSHVDAIKQPAGPPMGPLPRLIACSLNVCVLVESTLGVLPWERDGVSFIGFTVPESPRQRRVTDSRRTQRYERQIVSADALELSNGAVVAHILRQLVVDIALSDLQTGML